jgi:Protein of unknown function (DUF2845)
MLQNAHHRVRSRAAPMTNFGGCRLIAENRGGQRATRARLKSSFVMVILALLPQLALGQSMRCGSKLITEGTSQAKVAALCGEPAQVLHPAASDVVVPGASDVVEEIWVYNFGPNKLMQRIRFRNGIVVSIGSVGYGY